MKEVFLAMTFPFAFCLVALLPSLLGEGLGVRCFSQGTWVQKANFSGTARAYGVGFSIGAKGYVGMVEKYTINTWTCYRDFWEFDPVTNTWTQKASFGGVTRIAAVGFSIGTKGYVGTGTNSNTWTCYNDFWEYDPATNIWIQKANFSGTRAFAVGFSIGNKGYIGTGSDGTTEYNDLWEWDQATDTWTQKSNFQGGLRESAAGFSIGNKGYIGTGWNGSIDKNDFWAWDQATDTWTPKANFAGTGRKGASGFSIGNYGYIGIGDTTYNTNAISLSDFWQYNSYTNAWTQMANYGGGVRGYAAAFVIGCTGKGYVGTGEVNGSSSHVYKDDFWEFTPSYPFPAVTNVDCFGNNSGSATINYGTPAYTYSWSSAPVQTTQTATGLYAGTYSVTVIDAAGCIFSDTVVIASPTGLTVIPPVITNANCFGTSSGTATVTATGGTPAYTYSWNPIGQLTSTATGLAAGVYTITITDNNGCIIKTLAAVTQPTAVTASISSDTSICFGTSNTENIFASGGTPGYTYLWMPSGGTTTSVNIFSPATTTYTALVTDANGCLTQLLTTVTVVQNPAASISYTPGLCTASVQFTDNSTNAVVWNWNFGDGGYSATQQPLHVYNTLGSYSVTLTLSNQLGCKTIDNIIVDISSFSQLYIPNAFSPNDDGRDDMYYVFGKCITEMTFKVFDRWGEKVFETSDPATGWDGTYKGQLENAGVFMYEFAGELTTGEKVNQKGNITLMR